MRVLLSLLSLAAMACLLSACSFAPVSTPAVAKYFLQPLPQQLPEPTERMHKGSVLIMPIKSAPGYNSNNMHYVITPYQLQTFVTHQWVSPPAVMWQPILVSSLRHAGVAVVVSTPTPVQTDYSVQVHLYQFEQNFQRPQSVFDLTATAQVQNNHTGKVIALKSFSTHVPAQANTPYGGVLAANQAIAQMDAKISRFVVDSIH
jgi:cholesterol transport system auxiliary component